MCVTLTIKCRKNGFFLAENKGILEGEYVSSQTRSGKQGTNTVTAVTSGEGRKIGRKISIVLTAIYILFA